jgi:hypothetical protein
MAEGLSGFLKIDQVTLLVIGVLSHIGGISG